MKLSSLLAATAAAAFATSAANAAVFDFVAQSAGNEHGVADGDVESFAAGDLTFTTSSPQDGDAVSFAYFDDLSSGKPGGLGVCGDLDAAGQCDPSRDDNVTGDARGPETLRINFALLDGGVFEVFDVDYNGTPDLNMNGIGDKEEEHLPLDTYEGGSVRVTTSTGFDQVLSFAVASSTYFGFVEWIQFDYVDTNFYISSISDVPIPGALPLLLSGVAGLGFASRRRKDA